MSSLDATLNKKKRNNWRLRERLQKRMKTERFGEDRKRNRVNYLIFSEDN